MTWPPTVGDPMPRAEEAWCEDVKWVDWLLAERGHGEDWRRVFHIGSTDRDRVWEALRTATVDSRIDDVRQTPDGITCAVVAEIVLGDRSAAVRIVWHYADAEAPPRLVTAYPTPYTRPHGIDS